LTRFQEAAAKAALDEQFYGRCVTAFQTAVARALAVPRDAQRLLQV
jgi:hypothetical protein